ncbi:MAG: hypothetical protein DDT41_01601 [candidate division WS2 bacterium]|nr:hypothetical protein [Candidatus Psychracetigena formicireducens]
MGILFTILRGILFTITTGILFTITKTWVEPGQRSSPVLPGAL